MPDRASEGLLEQSSGSVNRERTFMRGPSPLLISAAATTTALTDANVADIPRSGCPGATDFRCSGPFWPARQVSNADQAWAAARWHDQSMTAAADTFTRFLDVLTETLDDHAAPPASWLRGRTYPGSTSIAWSPRRRASRPPRCDDGSCSSVPPIS
jgi:hypothetical protein